MPAPLEKHLTAAGKTSVIDLLDAHTDLSRQQLKSAMMKGAVWLESGHGIARVRRAKKRLQAGDVLHLYYDERVLQQQPPAARLLSDEDDYSVWEKPAGMFSQGSKWGDHCTLYRWAETQLNRPAYIVHRLDRAASGLMLIAHNKHTTTAFLQRFQQHGIEKHYRAVVEGDISRRDFPFTIDTPLDERPAHSTLLQARHDAGHDNSEVIVSIASGRKHQIRRHLAGLGHPIVGDRLYGTTVDDSDLQLRAIMLKFLCPVDDQVKMWTLDSYAPSTWKYTATTWQALPPSTNT